MLWSPGGRGNGNGQRGVLKMPQVRQTKTEQIRERGRILGRIYMPFELVIRIELLKAVGVGCAKKPGHPSNLFQTW